MVDKNFRIDAIHLDSMWRSFVFTRLSIGNDTPRDHSWIHDNAQHMRRPTGVFNHHCWSKSIHNATEANDVILIKTFLLKPFHASDDSKQCFEMSMSYGVVGQKIKNSPELLPVGSKQFHYRYKYITSHDAWHIKQKDCCCNDFKIGSKYYKGECQSLGRYCPESKKEGRGAIARRKEVTYL